MVRRESFFFDLEALMLKYNKTYHIILFIVIITSKCSGMYHIIHKHKQTKKTYIKFSDN